MSDESNQSATQPAAGECDATPWPPCPYGIAPKHHDQCVKCYLWRNSDAGKLFALRAQLATAEKERAAFALALATEQRERCEQGDRDNAAVLAAESKLATVTAERDAALARENQRLHRELDVVLGKAEALFAAAQPNTGERVACEAWCGKTMAIAAVCIKDRQAVYCHGNTGEPATPATTSRPGPPCCPVCLTWDCPGCPAQKSAREGHGSALHCEHANEVRRRCRCHADCYCKGRTCPASEADRRGEP